MAIFTTFLTTPLVTYLRRDMMGSIEESETLDNPAPKSAYDGPEFSMMICLNQMEHVPPLMKIVQLMNSQPMVGNFSGNLHVHAIRILELGDRDSDFLKISNSSETLRRDPLVTVLQTFALLSNISIRFHLSASISDAYGLRLVSESKKRKCQLLIAPLDCSNLHVAHTILAKSETPVAFVIHRDGDQISMPFHGTNLNIHRKSNRKAKILYCFIGGEDDRELTHLYLRLIASRNHFVHLVRIKYHETKTCKLETGDLEKEQEKTGPFSTFVGVLGSKKMLPNLTKFTTFSSKESIDNGHGGDFDGSSTAQGMTASSSIPRSLHATKSPDDIAFENIRDYTIELMDPDQYKIEEWEHCEPHEFVHQLAQKLTEEDTLILGNRHPILEILAISKTGDINAPSMEDIINSNKSNTSKNASENSQSSSTIQPSRSLFPSVLRRTLTQDACIASSMNGIRLGSNLHMVNTLRNSDKVLGSLAHHLIRAQVTCTMLIYHGNGSLEQIAVVEEMGTQSQATILDQNH
jgi:hypothetical protein